MSLRRHADGGSLRRPVDVREALKGQLAGQDAAPRPVWNNAVRFPDAGVEDHYLVLDSFERDAAGSSLETGTFRFGLGRQTHNQTIGCPDLQNVFQLQVFPFDIPVLEENPYTLNDPQTDLGLPPLAANPGPPAAGSLSGGLTQLPYGRITMYFTGLSGQSISDANGRRHHFEFDAALLPPKNDRIRLTPVMDCLTFTTPVSEIDSFTVQFYNPFQPVAFPADRLAVTLTSVTSPPSLDLAPNGQAHNLVVGDRIHVSGAATADEVINRYLNRPGGLLVGDGTTATHVRLNPDVDATALGAAPFASSTQVVVEVPKNRIRILLRVRGRAEGVTNLLSP